MPITFTIEIPGLTQEQLDRANDYIFEHLGGPPAGLIAHMESDGPNGIVVTDIWESQAEFEQFYESTLQHALTGAGVALGGQPEFRNVSVLFGNAIDETDYTEIAGKFYSAFTSNDPGLVELFTDDYVEHEEFPGIPPTREGVAQWVGMMHNAFSDFTLTPLEVTGHAGHAAVRFRMTGTHTGEFMGMPATGRSVDVTGIDYVHLTPDGKCREHWGAMDAQTLMVQLGVPAQQTTSIELPAEQPV